MDTRRIISLIIFLIAAATAISASEYLVRPITLDHGLSQTSVRCVLRDRKGYLWIGTDFGLNRYDNNKVTRYYFDPSKEGSLPDNQVVFLIMDNEGTLFVGLNHGLVKYDYLTDSFQEITDQGKRIDAQSARLTKEGILIGGFGKLYFYDTAQGSINALPITGGSNSAYINIPRPWSAGCYVLQTRWDGLWLYQSASSKIEQIEFVQEKNITATQIDTNGNLWVSPFEKGLKCYDHSGKLIKTLDTSNSPISSDMIYAIIEVDGNLWIGSEQGIDIIDLQTYKVTNLEKRANGPKNCTILCLWHDQNGTIYAGTLRHGVLCIYDVPMRTFTNLTADASFFGFTVTSIIPTADSSQVWVGFDGEGVAMFDPIAETFEPVKGTNDMKVTSLAKYDDRHILISTYNKGIKLLDTKDMAIKTPPEVFKTTKELSKNNTMAVDLYTLNDGRILYVSDELFAISQGSHVAAPIAFPGIRGAIEKLNPIYFDGNTLLTSDKRHIYLFTAADTICKVVYSANTGENITAAAYDGKSYAWVATNKKLAKCHVPSGDVKEFSTTLVHNITSLALEGDKIWIGADNKLFLGTPDGTFTVFGATEGMDPNQFINKAELLTDEFLLLGGVNGLLKINRKDIRNLLAQPTIAKISVSDVTVDNNRIIVNDSNVVVPNNHSTIKINIIDNDNSALRNKLFRYTISGFKRDLTIETFDRTLTLNMLPWGKYIVKVSYRLNNGQWAQPETLLEIDVESPLWTRWWAIVIYVILTTAILALIYRKVKARRRRHAEELRQSALEDKVQFLTSLHKRLRTPLTLILSPLSTLIENTKNDKQSHPASTISTLEDIYNNSMEMRDIIEALPENHALNLFPTEGTKTETHKTAPLPDAEPQDEEGQNLLDDFDTTPYCALIVEENEKLRSFMQVHLQSIFKNIEISVNAKEAMLRIKDLRPDIIIIDVDLDDEDGYILCGEIKNTAGLRHIPVILLTSGNSLGQKRRSYTHGADSYISKPFDIDVLVARCKNLLLNRTIMRNRYDNPTPADKMATKTRTNSDESFILQLNQIIAENLSNAELGVDFLTKKMLISRTTFYQRMRQLTGKSIGQYISDYRMSEAKKMLSQRQLPINEIAEALGFSSQRYFSTSFKEKTGMSPSEFRNANSQKND